MHQSRFGQIAVEFGYITSAQLKMAMLKQLEDDLAGREQRLLGEVLSSQGILTHAQVLIVADEIRARTSRHETKPDPE